MCSTDSTAQEVRSVKLYGPFLNLTFGILLLFQILVSSLETLIVFVFLF